MPLWNDLPDDILALIAMHGAAMTIQRCARRQLERLDAMPELVEWLPDDHVEHIPAWWLPWHNQLLHVPAFVAAWGPPYEIGD